ncbi:glycosyltransferase family 4 protein [Mucilaginibacter sp. SP1R1]|uniref:glycosyltransferase family 4 protein n=1 Tax=Mucilaginibacter sp. SP1R1 TaxID=2723091 RepID=UPI003B00C196
MLDAYEQRLPIKSIEKDSDEWIKQQGPYTPGLIKHLEENHAEYDALIFFTYLYYPTIYGIKIAPEKSILIPTAHDEQPIYYPWFKLFFKTPAAILYNTISEKKFVNLMFNNQDIYSDVVAVGVEPLQPAIVLQASDILNYTGEYLIYIGRIDVAKGCKVLFDHFLKYKSSTGKNLKLVLVGLAFMEIPRHPDIVVMGFVDEDVKIALLKGATALIIPSFYESLSMVTLESMAYGIPVIANEQCEVLKDHINNSKAGFLYHDFNTFQQAINTLTNPGVDITTLGQNAQKYVTENYTWPVVIEKINKAINFVAGK